MQIPLDYYRILGVPVQTSAEQLQQAYRDRTLQLPQREYSQAAIEARNRLIAVAYTVLSDPEQRQRYDSSYFASTEEEGDNVAEPSDAVSSEPVLAASELNTPVIEIADEQFIGALLILQELGEYELVLELGRSFLSTNTGSLESGSASASNSMRSDIVLTVALAYLELGREQWQQGQYESAASSLEVGQNLLSQNSLFPSVAGEVKADLDKLRPYRILELLSQSETNAVERQQGLQLLRDILQERGGIDGPGDDGSGLSVEDFLRFIQQLRSYLSVAEQQSLFELESRRPSAVATYLAVYALIARGFAERLPVLIHQAKLMLMRLANRQDVYVEQAICSLLLGQTLEASRALEQSHEKEPLAFIHENSQGAPDLLPGLCLYCEGWLQNEVFPHFRDLAQHRALLKEYFADEQVQAYLEALPAELEAKDPANNIKPQPLNSEVQTSGQQSSDGEPLVSQQHANKVRERRHQKPMATNTKGRELSKQRKQGGKGAGEQGKMLPTTYHLPPTTYHSPATSHQPLATSGVAVLPEKERIAKLSQGQSSTSHALSSEQLSPQPSRRRARNRAERRANRLQQGEGSHRQGDSSIVFVGVPTVRKNRLLLLLVGTGLGIVILWFLMNQAYGLFRQFFTKAPSLQTEQLMVELNRPLVPIPSPKTPQKAAKLMSQEMAAQVIHTWLSTKASAFGPTHAANQLEQILVEPALSQWQQRVQNDKANKRYRQYKHSLKVDSVQTKASEVDRAQVEATVNELAQVYENGRLNQAASYDEAVKVRYEAIRHNGQWRIRAMQVMQ